MGKFQRWLEVRLPRVFWLLGLAGILAAGCTPSGLRLEQSPLLSALERKAGLIVLIGADGNLYTLDQAGGRRKAVTADAQVQPGADGSGIFYQFPTWSPDGKRLAFVGVSAEGGAVASVSLFSAAPDGSARVELFSSLDEYPFYLYWSPDGRQLSFLTADTGGGDLALHLVPAEGGEDRRLSRADAMYWSWSPESRTMLIHRGGSATEHPGSDLLLLEPAGSGEGIPLSLRPAQFQAPAWSPDGERLLMATEGEDGKSRLVLTDPQGAIQQELASLPGPAFFGWSPDGKRVAYLADDPEAEGERPGVLTLVAPGDPEGPPTVIREELIAGFFWSPNGRKLAYLLPSLQTLPDESGRGEGQPVLLLTVMILDVRRGTSARVATFRPTPQFINLLPFFDQYQHSLRLWSPDSRNLVISAVSDAGESGIYLIEAAANLQPRFLEAGELAVWSWK